MIWLRQVSTFADPGSASAYRLSHMHERPSQVSCVILLCRELRHAGQLDLAGIKRGGRPLGAGAMLEQFPPNEGSLHIQFMDAPRGGLWEARVPWGCCAGIDRHVLYLLLPRSGLGEVSQAWAAVGPAVVDCEK